MQPDSMDTEDGTQMLVSLLCATHVHVFLRAAYGKHDVGHDADFI